MLTIYLYDLPPMFRNRSHMLTSTGGRPMNIKTPLCREFEKDLEIRLKDYTKTIEEFRTLFNPLQDYIKAEYTIYTPTSQLLTKEGKVSNKAGDSDSHKVMRDVLYKSLGLDDKVERDSRFHTPFSKSGNWDYRITLIIDKIENLNEK